MKPSEEQPQRIKGQTNNTPIGPLGDISHKRITLFGKRLSVIRLDGEEFLIGVQIASLLKRETFNMYRSMKIKNILIQRANVEQVDFLCKCNAVRTGTHSVTLIPYHSGLYFISEAMSRQKKSGELSNESTEQNSHQNHQNNNRILNNNNNTNNQPKHRRKANRWEVHRSIKQQDLHLLSDCNFVDFNTPFDDLIALAKQHLAKSKLNSSSDRHPHHHLHFALLEKNQSKKKSKSNINNSLNNSNNNINNLLFAAEEDEINSVDSFDNSPSSPLSLNSSSSSVSNSSSFPSSPSFSSFNSPQENLFQFLPQFNLGIFSDNNSNNTNIITKELNNNNNQFSVPTF